MKASLALAWVAPCSLLGLLAALPCVLAGGAARRVGRTLEVALPRAWRCRLPFVAITFGHVIVGESFDDLARLRAHEQAHVAQYERWGPLFLLAYPLASVVAWGRGEGAYRGNRFEREARSAAQRGGGARQ